MHNPRHLYDLYAQEYNKSGNLLLKIQCYLRFIERGQGLEEIREIDHDKPFIAYNKDRTFWCHLDSQSLDAEDVKAILTERGGVALKAYFWAFMEAGRNEVVLITEPRLPAQPW